MGVLETEVRIAGCSASVSQLEGRKVCSIDSWHFPAACSLETYCKATSLAEEENGQGVHGPKEQ